MANKRFTQALPEPVYSAPDCQHDRKTLDLAVEYDTITRI